MTAIEGSAAAVTGAASGIGRALAIGLAEDSDSGYTGIAYLAPGADGAAFRAAWERRLLPALDAFDPDLILISAGFDAHADDPLAGLTWREDDFVWLTQRLCDIADAVCGGRVVSALEGGYDLAALQASVAAHVGVLEERGR